MSKREYNGDKPPLIHRENLKKFLTRECDGMKIGPATMDAVDALLVELLKRASERAQANMRVVLRDYDF